MQLYRSLCNPILQAKCTPAAPAAPAAPAPLELLHARIPEEQQQEQEQEQEYTWLVGWDKILFSFIV